MLVLILAFSTGSLSAQNDYVFIGEGGTGTSGTSIVSPINPNTRNFRTQILYTSAEIAAAGGLAGNITRLAWNVHQTTSALQNYTIKIGHTSSTTVGSHISTASTQVYTTTSYSPSLGLNDIIFSTPFSWNVHRIFL